LFDLTGISTAALSHLLRDEKDIDPEHSGSAFKSLDVLFRFLGLHLARLPSREERMAFVQDRRIPGADKLPEYNSPAFRRLLLGEEDPVDEEEDE
jgi:hypothetical protein